MTDPTDIMFEAREEQDPRAIPQVVPCDTLGCTRSALVTDPNDVALCSLCKQRLDNNHESKP